MISKSALTDLAGILKKLNLRCRVQASFESEMSEWSTFVAIPSEGYFETSASGPVSIKDLKWIEIDPVKQVDIGRRVPPKKENLKLELAQELVKHLIPFEDGEYLRISVNP